MAITEHTINDALAEVLSGTRSLWRTKDVVKSENIGEIKGSAKRPDILVAEPLVSPVVIETEVIPAASVQGDATQRLGQQLLPSGRDILSSIAVRMPLRLRELPGCVSPPWVEKTYNRSFARLITVFADKGGRKG